MDLAQSRNRRALPPKPSVPDVPFLREPDLAPIGEITRRRLQFGSDGDRNIYCRRRFTVRPCEDCQPKPIFRSLPDICIGATMGVELGPGRICRVSAEIAVPGSIDRVWRAIATGPEISSWFVPTDFSLGPDRAPSREVSNFGPKMDAVATATHWDPPRSFSAISDDFAPGGPAVTAQWTVGALEDLSCVVRVQHSLHADTDEWDGQLEEVESGWPQFLRILRLVQAHFPGQSCRMIDLSAGVEEIGSGWAMLTEGLGLSGAAAGERRCSLEGAVRFSGIVESAEGDHQILLRLEEPAPGLVQLLAIPLGGAAHLALRAYLYGDRAAATAAEIAPARRNWMEDRFA